MLRTLTELRDCAIKATDGLIGRIADVYFDDEQWVVRYLVVDTGTWLPGRHVLISPISITHSDWSGQRISVALTREQVRQSPDIDADKPVSRQQEEHYLGYYGYPYYWGGTGLWGMAPVPAYVGAPPFAHGPIAEHERAVAGPTNRKDSHLRSSQKVTGYHILATDGEIGHVDDFVIDEDTWAIRYIVVDTSNWWGGKHVLVSPEWIEEVSWVDARVVVDVNREAVKGAAPYESAAQLDRHHEEALYEHYRRRAYWNIGPGSRSDEDSRIGRHP